MDTGVGLDANLNLSLEEQAQLSEEAAQLGYTSIWTPEGTGQDSFQICLHRWAASRKAVPDGVTTGIAVSPVMWRTPVAFAMAGGTVSQITGGRFIMGIGSGGVYRPATRRTLGLPKLSALAMMRDYVATTRALVRGESVNYEGEVAMRYRYADGEGELGFIASVTKPFCSTCHRARLSADGKIYTCLFAAEGHDLKTLIREKNASVD